MISKLSGESSNPTARSHSHSIFLQPGIGANARRARHLFYCPLIHGKSSRSDSLIPDPEFSARPAESSRVRLLLFPQRIRRVYNRRHPHLPKPKIFLLKFALSRVYIYISLLKEVLQKGLLFDVQLKTSNM